MPPRLARFAGAIPPARRRGLEGLGQGLGPGTWARDLARDLGQGLGPGTWDLDLGLGWGLEGPSLNEEIAPMGAREPGFAIRRLLAETVGDASACEALPLRVIARELFARCTVYGVMNGLPPARSSPPGTSLFPANRESGAPPVAPLISFLPGMRRTVEESLKLGQRWTGPQAINLPSPTVAMSFARIREPSRDCRDQCV